MNIIEYDETKSTSMNKDKLEKELKTGVRFR